MYCFIEVGRWCVMGGDLPTDLLTSALIWTVSIVTVGFMWFKAAEDRYARD